MSQAREPDPLSENLGYLLKVASTALHAAMEAALRPAGLTLSQFSCLELLSRTPDQTNAQLARGAFVTPQSMNEVLQGLQRRGLVERPDAPESGRARPTRLTAQDRLATNRARAALADVDSTIKRIASQRPHLVGDLRAIADALTNS